MKISISKWLKKHDLKILGTDIAKDGTAFVSRKNGIERKFLFRIRLGRISEPDRIESHLVYRTDQRSRAAARDGDIDALTASRCVVRTIARTSGESKCPRCHGKGSFGNLGVCWACGGDGEAEKYKQAQYVE